MNDLKLSNFGARNYLTQLAAFHTSEAEKHEASARDAWRDGRSTPAAKSQRAASICRNTASACEQGRAALLTLHRVRAWSVVALIFSPFVVVLAWSLVSALAVLFR